MAAKVDVLRSSQDGITAQVDTLRGQVDQANLLAEARAASTRVPDLINCEAWGGHWGSAYGTLAVNTLAL